MTAPTLAREYGLGATGLNPTEMPAKIVEVLGLSPQQNKPAPTYEAAKDMAAQTPTVKMPALDLSKYAVNPQDPSMNQANWEKRADGSSKGFGFLGMLKRPDGKVSSEISVEMDGKEFPTLVPTLTQQEVDWLMNNPVNDPKKIPTSIIQKALQHANDRIAQGKSPFAGPEDAPGAQTRP